MSHQVPKGRVALIATILFFAFFLTTEVTHAEVTPGDTGNFITTWNTENPGTSANNQITIPGTGGGYNYDVYWVNTASSTQTGTTTTTSSSLTLTFPEPGIYQVEIAGAFPRIFFNNGGDRQKILTVEQWGDIAWNSMDRAFNGASNLRVPASDAPDLSGVTSMYRMFRAATVFNDPVNHWDVSNVDTINGLFWEAANFNQSLNDWNISSATNISNAFRGAIQFNQPLDNWDTSLVFSMSSMFSGAIQFNQDLSNWNISSITPDANCSANDGMCNIFLGVALSTHNLDATLQSWAQQAVDNNIQNIPLHLGLKTYSQTGATAIQTLRDLGWTVDEQYKATYSPSTRATLLGQGTQSPLNSNDT
ncbi:MAG: BspA family leucine-rich repeat surface protein, partial [Candidatus Paceibacteria bacterium]